MEIAWRAVIFLRLAAVSCFSIHEELFTVILDNVVAGRRADINDVLGAANNLATTCEELRVGLDRGWCTIENSHVELSDSPTDDDPHPLDTSLEPVLVFGRDVAEQLRSVTHDQRLSPLARRNLKGIGPFGVSGFA